MRISFLHRWLLLFLVLASGYAGAQDTEPTKVHVQTKDTAFTIDPSSIEDFYDYEDEDYDDTDVLYFTAKEDTTALYDSSRLDWRNVPDSMVRQLKDDDAFWYVDKDMQAKKKEARKQKDGSWWQRFLEGLFDILGNPIVRQILFYGIIFLFILAATWFLINNQMNILGRSKQRIRSAREMESGAEDILSSDLEKALAEAEVAKDYRLAVRIRYLQLLKALAEAQLIQYRDDATNMEYLTRLYGKPCYPQFFSLTRHYEYAWYGEAEVTADIYQRLTSDFTSLHKTLLTA